MLLAVCTIRVSGLFQVLLGLQVECQLRVAVEETIAGLAMLLGLFDLCLLFGNLHLFRWSSVRSTSRRAGLEIARVVPFDGISPPSSSLSTAESSTNTLCVLFGWWQNSWMSLSKPMRRRLMMLRAPFLQANSKSSGANWGSGSERKWIGWSPSGCSGTSPSTDTFFFGCGLLRRCRMRWTLLAADLSELGGTRGSKARESPTTERSQKKIAPMRRRKRGGRRKPTSKGVSTEIRPSPWNGAKWAVPSEACRGERFLSRDSYSCNILDAMICHDRFCLLKMVA